MTTLHLGVIELPYSEAPEPGKKDGVVSGTQTTGDVAEWLENKYHVMEVFYHEHEQEIADAMASSVAGTFESLLMGASNSQDPFGTAMADIEHSFREFIDNSEMEQLGYPGVPTKAALKGVNHRLKKKRGPRRPSFVDTGLYESSFKAWAE